MFANGKVPIAVESTPMPEGIEEFVHLETPVDKQADPYGFEGDGREFPAGDLEANETEQQEL